MKNEGDNSGSSVLILTIAASLGSIILPQILESRWKISVQSLSKSAALGALCSTTSVALVVGLEAALLSVDNFVADKYLVWYEDNKNINLKKGGYMTNKLDTRIGSLANAVGLNATEVEVARVAEEKAAAEKAAGGEKVEAEEAEVAKEVINLLEKVPENFDQFCRKTGGAQKSILRKAAYDLKCSSEGSLSYEFRFEAEGANYQELVDVFEKVYEEIQCPVIGTVSGHSDGDEL